MWLTLSLLTAIFVSAQEVWIKKYFSHLSAHDMTVYPLLYSLPLFTITLFFVPIPQLDITFWIYFIISLPLNGICIFFYMKAIKISPISLTVPYLAFTPVFIILTGFIFLDELPNRWGILGILIVCAGSYILNIDHAYKSVFTPFKAVFREAGSRIMFMIAFLFSIIIEIKRRMVPMGDYSNKKYESYNFT